MVVSWLELKEFSVTPDRGTYLPGEKVRLTINAESTTAGSTHLEIQTFRGLEFISKQSNPWNLQIGHNQIEIPFQPQGNDPAGYGVQVILFDGNTGKPISTCETAFDILPDWTVFPRYGFVCDFSPSRSNIEETIETLNRFHINGLQFYDWQFRHDTLIPPQDDFSDPLGRPLSLKITKALIASAHRFGMKAMPYLAIYAASAAFWKSHPDWDLYDQNHALIPFGDDFLGIMNPVAQGPWSTHLLEECQKVLTQLPFDGLHIDQYGDPKTGFDELGQPVDLPKAFVDFVTAAVKQHPQAPVLFNAVGNWPIESLAKAPTAFNYIEIWPPKTTYSDVADIVRNARQLSGEKPVVIALYLPANRPINNRLADAIIFSAGGTRIELGENGRLLSDPYFPKHEPIDAGFSEILRRQLELIIRFEEWISPLIKESALPKMQLPEGIQPFFRKTVQGFSLSLVNLGHAGILNWTENHPQPEIKRGFTIEVSLDEPIESIWLVSADRDSLSPEPVEFQALANAVTIEVPSLEIWDVLLFVKKKA
jgi:dextranase